VSAWRREAEDVLSATVAPDGPLPAATTRFPAWHEWDDLSPTSPAPVVLLSLVGHAPGADDRRRGFERLHATLPADGLLIVADHNRPRARGAALAAVVGPPLVPGGSPSRRWRRLAQPTARELQAAGFRVVRLALVAHERVQLVIARRA
jgi:hypothetical protein